MKRARFQSCAWLALGLAAGCGGESPPQRDCLARVWVPAGEPATIVGSWDGWKHEIAPEPYDEAWQLARFSLEAGEHGYLLAEGGLRRRDPLNPLSTFDGQEKEVSLLLVPDCSRPKLLVDHFVARPEGLTLEARFLTAATVAPLDPASLRAVGRDGRALTVVEANPDTGRVVLSGSASSGPKHSLRFEASDTAGVAAETEHVSGWVGGRDLRDEIIYQVTVDRFRGDGGAPLAPPPTPGSRAGGTLDGVRAALDEGYFASFGATALWLSPVYLNPSEAREGLDGRLYEGYHGYWPLDSRAVDPRLGGESALEALIAHSHEDGLRVLLDVVPNHVYEDHPRYLEHRDDGWFHPPGCVCGTVSCPWAGNIEQCWFTPYLPDVRWQHGPAARAALDDVRFWLRRFDLDGVRVDAVPMMPLSATRRLAHELRSMTSPREATFLLGEVFTGPGAIGHLTPFLGPAGLDSVFDFPLMWALHAAIASRSAGFEDVEAILRAEEEVLAGSGSILARMIDNHDTVRFVSVAAGDAFGDPWDAPASQPSDAAPYEKLAVAFAVIFTLPGIPVIYQGDEIGLAGGGDPDNRRVLPPESELIAPQHALRDAVQRLGRLRRDCPLLRRGERMALYADGGRYLYERALEGERLIVAVSAEDVDTLVPPVGKGAYHDIVADETIDLAQDLLLPARAFRILVPAGSPCAGAWR